MRRASGIPVFIAAALLLGAASGIVLPAPSRVLLPVSVGAPELSPWLLAAAVLLAVVAARSRWTKVKGATLFLLLIAAGLALRALIQIPAAISQIDNGMAAAFGAGYAERLEPGIRATLRPRAINLWELLGGIRTGPAVPIADVIYASPDGELRSARVYRPATAGGPVIVQIYGGAWQRGSPADDPTMATYLAARGYVVIAVDYRHAPRWRWPVQLDDVRAALQWVGEHAADYGGDSSRIAIIGRSAGAHLALMAAYTSRTTGVRAVVSLYGPTDLIGGYRELPRPDPIGVRGTLEALTGGTPDTSPDVYRDASPITYATAAQPPTLQIIGGHDHVVLPRFSDALDQRLRGAGNLSIRIELPWADHAFDAITFGPSGQLALYTVERFLAVTLRR